MILTGIKIIIAASLLRLFSADAQARATKLGAGINYLSKYIASDSFILLKQTCNDLASTDSLYCRALNYTDNDYSEALLSLTFAVIPYNHIPVLLPLLKLPVNIPLPSSCDSVFYRKNENLPSKLLFDTPPDSFGDKDKLAHFFGSAYLAYISGIFDFTEIIGIFVEEFEEKFYVQASIDRRDLFADYLGRLFGMGLKENKHLLPSEVLVFYPLTFIRYTL